MNKKQLLALAGGVALSMAAIPAQAGSTACGSGVTKTTAITCTPTTGGATNFAATAFTINGSQGVWINYEDSGPASGFGVATSHIAGDKGYGLSTNGGTIKTCSAFVTTAAPTAVAASGC